MAAPTRTAAEPAGAGPGGTGEERPGRRLLGCKDLSRPLPASRVPAVRQTCGFQPGEAGGSDCAPHQLHQVVCRASWLFEVGSCPFPAAWELSPRPCSARRESAISIE